MGGDKDEVITPKAPEAQSLASQLQDYINAQPQLFKLQQEQAPQEAALQLQLLQQYGADLGLAQRQAQEAVNPELTALQNQLFQEGLNRLGQAQTGLTDDLKNLYKENFQSQVYDPSSRIGADAVSKSLLGADIAYRNDATNLGLSLAGYQPIGQPYAPTVTNQLAGLSAGNALNMNSNNYAAQLGYSRPFIKEGTPTDWAGIIGGVAGIGAGLATGNPMLAISGAGSLGGLKPSSSRPIYR